MYKLLKILMLSLLLSNALADEPAPPQPLSPVQAALAEARAAVAEGRSNDAIATLERLFSGGFTAVHVLTNDDALASLAGTPAYDELVEKMSRQAYPCEYDERFREFDFWAGEWDVHVASGALAGTNVITIEQRGCQLVENWSSATGGSGTSINYFDKVADEWVQIWNDPGGNQIHIRGGMTDDGMLLTGTIHYVASDTTAQFRGLWTPLPDGRVRQFFEQSADGATWSPWFEGFYSRRVSVESDER